MGSFAVGALTLNWSQDKKILKYDINLTLTFADSAAEVEKRTMRNRAVDFCKAVGFDRTTKVVGKKRGPNQYAFVFATIRRENTTIKFVVGSVFVFDGRIDKARAQVIRWVERVYPATQGWVGYCCEGDRWENGEFVMEDG